ncbi:MAG: hypothetical protein IKZ81_02535 [Clostridia bacterium]|nr:hypothetical protein [Clostridia bacterium]MBR5769536.1 hypothetical protein [Clostridia bacterium]MBR5942201.1 hypothetical protein [Clostridia bacterium]
MDIEKTIAKITGDKSLVENFKKDPVAAVKSVVGSVPPEVIDKIVDGVKAKIASDKVSGALDAVKGLF